MLLPVRTQDLHKGGRERGCIKVPAKNGREWDHRKAYFTEGRDVGRHEALAEIVSEAGLPKAEAVAFLDSVAGTKEVSEEVNKGLELCLEGVHFFVVNGAPAVTGAQDAKAFLQVFQHTLGPDQSS
jgi:predicted DsbA family dithiol-disulfide isomerase